ncbi:hypothetical protein FC89_GL002113 [Liquorilactobacillus ghanensis DSM 18630]|uniref:EpsG family protein n=1 Tax=Liquorilactobacillus ghanensis DSM 18630 TaxID=1423750 RepID=A0A0R1VQV5_9LACO|nr:EpsG family protein [Liquorilactobacillus ghanensis]KRM08002.1 hypothetical protein FC89_GL002113 [Liquorilactobacillus ghanensis DSM 18630]
MYIFELASILFSGFLYEIKFLSKKIFLFVSFFLLFIVQALRAGTVGTDTQFYLNTYDVSKFLSFSYIIHSFPRMTIYGHYGLVENGYVLINKVLSCFFNSNQTILIFSSLIICLNFAHFIDLHCKDVFIATLIFACSGLYMNSFNLVRQFLAMSICINAYNFFKNEKYVKGSLIILLAYFIHESSAIFFFIMIMYAFMRKTSLKMDYLLMAFPLFFSFIIRVVAIILPQYTGYTENHLFEVTIHGIVLLWVFEFIIIILATDKKDKHTLFLIFCWMSYVILQFLSLNVTGMYRVSFWFLIFSMELMSNVPHELNNNNKSILFKIIYSIVLSLAFLSFSTSPSLLYSFFWK